MSTCSHRAGQGPEPHVQPTVIFETAVRTVRVPVEVVRSEEDRARGLMFRRSLPAQQGMLFVFDQQEIQSFWMKNTYIPLDMIFIQGSGRILRIAENAKPLSTDLIPSEGPVLAVLEVIGGTAHRLGIAPGDRVAYPIFKAN
jgi:uncharacterized membrane protein (UPF0127 family)